MVSLSYWVMSSQDFSQDVPCVCPSGWVQQEKLGEVSLKYKKECFP